MAKTEMQVSWVWTDDGDGNHDFGDITRSFQTSAFLTTKEADAVKAYLKPFYESGRIMDVYVGPVGKNLQDHKRLMKAIKDEAGLVEVAPDRARCPDCGIPTIPDREGLTWDEKLCDQCFKRRYGEERAI